MNIMRQAQVSAMVRNASGRIEYCDLGKAAMVRLQVAPVAPSDHHAWKQAMEAVIRSQKPFAASVARQSAGGVLDVTRLEDAEPRLVKLKRSPNCKPAISGLTTEAPTGRYQGLGFRSE